MTLRLPEAEVRQLYEWWRRGEISMRQAARALRVDPRTLHLRWAQWDEGCRHAVQRRKIAAAKRKERDTCG